ncbi:MAG TPA: hypothetical protein DCY07_04750 [Rhodospirillaceae bacterium]|nr:hypothetical protein [Rhodospirillaceae bacterium]
MYGLFLVGAALLAQHAHASDTQTGVAAGESVTENVDGECLIDPESVMGNEIGAEFLFTLNGEEGAAFCSAIDVKGKPVYDKYGFNEIRMGKNVFKRIGNGRVMIGTSSDYQSDGELLEVTYYDRGGLSSYECEVDEDNLFIKNCTKMPKAQLTKKEVLGAMDYYTDVCMTFYASLHSSPETQGIGANWYPETINEMEQDAIDQLRKAGIIATMDSKRVPPKRLPLAKPKQ